MCDQALVVHTTLAYFRCRPYFGLLLVLKFLHQHISNDLLCFSFSIPKPKHPPSNLPDLHLVGARQDGLRRPLGQLGRVVLQFGRQDCSSLERENKKGT